MSEEPIWDKTSRLAAAIAYFMNLMGLLASPRIVAKTEQWPSREHLLEHADMFLSFASGADEATVSSAGRPIDLEGILPHASKLRASLETWTPGPAVPPELQASARALLQAFGVPEPPEGWDQFEGGPEDATT